jgi:hypothetical protein
MQQKRPYALRRVGHTPASEIQSQAHVGHRQARARRKMPWLVVLESGRAKEHIRVMHVRVRLPEIDRSDFEKTKS